MSDAMARLVAAFTALLLVGALVALWVTSHPGAGGATARAEFDDVYPLLPGMHVRVDGAVAGSVGDIELTDHGSALVTLRLFEGTAPPRADATAAIRQQDITGDSYVALEPGDAPDPLGDSVIERRRTTVAPRFDDLLDTFDRPVRQGLELAMTELGKGLERRGEDLNGAILELRPGLRAADRALAEVRSQNAALRGLIVDAEQVTGQAAAHSTQLGGLVDSLATTLRATGERGPQLDAAVARLPETASRARATLARLEALATDARPLATTFAGAVPDLATTLRRLEPFLDDTGATMEAVSPTLDLVDELLVKSLPTLREAPSHVLTAPLDIAAGAGAVLDTLLGDEELQRSLFSADGYGQGERAADDVGLGAIGVERGDQAGYEGNDPDRRFLRAETVVSCETFGVPIRPGCLNQVLSASLHREPAGGSGRRPSGGGDRGGGDGPPPGGGSDGGAGEGEAPAAGQGGAGAGDDRGPVGDALDDVTDDLDDVLDQVGGAVGGVAGGGAPHGQEPGRGQGLGAVDDLLDFLTAP